MTALREPVHHFRRCNAEFCIAEERVNALASGYERAAPAFRRCIYGAGPDAHGLPMPGTGQYACTMKKFSPATPPQPFTPEGRPRRIGIEIEFANVTGPTAAALVVRHFGGQIKRVDAHRFRIPESSLGEFVVELDTQYVHKKEGQHSSAWTDGRIGEMVGDAASLVVPYEIVCPPVPWNRLDELNTLFDELRQHGAEGTQESPVYGFGLHLNVELASYGIEHILALFRAYLLLSDWLREEIGIDITRRLLPHASRFPVEYVLMVMDPDYRPDLTRFIEDYVLQNPSRNRELDLYPMLLHLAPEIVEGLVDDPLIKARPAWHYRLPNASIADPSWNAVVEWNRWVQVERLASDAARLTSMIEAYTAWYRRPAHERWLDTLRELLGNA